MTGEIDRAALFDRYRPLALNRGRKLAGRHELRVDDCQSSAVIGLWEASLTWEPYHGVGFADWACRNIFRRVVDDARRDHGWFSRRVVPVPRVVSGDAVDEVVAGAGSSPVLAAIIREEYERNARGIPTPARDYARSRLDAAQVREIKSLLGKVRATELGRRFRVTPSTIRDIRSGKTWRNIA